MDKQANNNLSPRLKFAVLGILGLVIVVIGVLFVRNEYLTKSDLPVIGRIDNFVLTNQFGRTVTLADLQGHVWIADIIFTRCAGPCPRMTEIMSRLQSLLPDQNLRFVTLTTDPEFDNPQVLKAYGDRFNADHSRWHFLTGSKEQIRNLAGINGLKLTAMEKEPEMQQDPNDLFIHSTVFMIVDKRGRLRGSSFESLEADFEEKIVPAVKSLLRERSK